MCVILTLANMVESAQSRMAVSVVNVLQVTKETGVKQVTLDSIMYCPSYDAVLFDKNEKLKKMQILSTKIKMKNGSRWLPLQC